MSGVKPWEEEWYVVPGDIGGSSEGTMTPRRESDDGFTVSTHRGRTGWRTDGGYPQYCMSEDRARLAAAAPDLYRALAKFVEANDVPMKEIDYDDVVFWCDEFKAALRKARGET